MTKIELKCSICTKISHKWPYEYRAIKNTEHYKCKKCKRINYETRQCPSCLKQFNTPSKSKKITCSYKCSNKIFRTGPNNGNWKHDVYRSTCFYYHKKECIICKECNIVAVHHYDMNHNNNNPCNLIPLCPTHHQYMHSKFHIEIKDQVDKYIRNFKLGFA